MSLGYRWGHNIRLYSQMLTATGIKAAKAQADIESRGRTPDPLGRHMNQFAVWRASTISSNRPGLGIPVLNALCQRSGSSLCLAEVWYCELNVR